LEPGADTVYLAYRLEPSHLNGHSRHLSLRIKLLVNTRDHHGNAPPWEFNPVIEPDGETGGGARGLTIRNPGRWGHGAPYTLRFFMRGGTITPDHTWYENFDLPVERERGLPEWDNHLCVGQAVLELYPGEWTGIVASLDEDTSPYLEEAMRRFHAHDTSLLARTRVQVGELGEAPSWVQQLILAAAGLWPFSPSPSPSPAGEREIIVCFSKVFPLSP
jgi:glycogen debranching enzyme-like protein